MTSEQIISDLKRLATDNAAFDAYLGNLKADRSIDQPALREIAIAFIGWEMARSAPRKKLIQLIADFQMLDQRRNARMAGIDRLGAW